MTQFLGVASLDRVGVFFLQAHLYSKKKYGRKVIYLSASIVQKSLSNRFQTQSFAIKRQYLQGFCSEI